MNSAGTVNVTVLTAQFATPAGAERKNATHVALRVGNTEATTRSAPAIANTASWNQPFSFPVTGEQSLEVELYEGEPGRGVLLAKAAVPLPPVTEPRAMTQTLKMMNGGSEVATLYVNLGVAPGTSLFSGLRAPLSSISPAMGSFEARNYATYAQPPLGAPFPPIAVCPPHYATGPAGGYVQPQAVAGGYTQTTPIPGGYTQTTTYPNGYAQTTQTSTAYTQPAGFAQTTSGYVPSSGFTQTASGYAPSTGFTQTASGYVPSAGFTKTASGYAPSAGFTQTTNGYAPSTGFAQMGQGTYGQTNTGYSQAAHGNTGYAAGQTGYARTAPFAQTADAFSPMAGGFAQPAPMAGGYTQTTAIPGGYAQATTYPNGYAQSSYTQSSSQVPPTTTVSYGPGNTTTATTYTSSEASYQSSQSNYSRLR